MGFIIKRVRIKVIYVLLYENNVILVNDNFVVGIGNFLKYLIVGLILNLVNFKVFIVGNRINVKEVKIEGVVIVWNKSVGVTLKLIILVKEFNFMLNLLFIFNFFVIFLLRKFKIVEKKMRMEVVFKYLFIFKVIEKILYNKFLIVNKFGIIFISWLNKFVFFKLIKFYIFVVIFIYFFVIFKNIWLLYYCKLIKFW